LGGGPFAALGRLVTRHPWRVIAVWIIVAVAVIATAPALPTTTNEASFLPSSYESIKAQNLQDQAFPQAGHVEAAAAIIVFARSDGGRLTPADEAKVASVAGTLNGKHITNILSITAGPVSPNGLVQTASVAMDNSLVNGSGTQAGDAIELLRSDIKPLVSGAGLYEGVTGAAAEQLDSEQSGNKAEEIVLLATLVLILVLLLIIFRSPVIAFMPIITIAIVAEVAQGLIADVNSALNLNADSQTTVILIVALFGIGTDYILFLMFRYRERLRAGDTPKQAVATAVERVGEVIASAASVVIVAFVALLLSSLSIFRSLGPTLAIAVAVTLIAALTLIPAVVTLLGTRVFWPSKAWQREPKGARFAAIGRSLGKRPAVFAGAPQPGGALVPDGGGRAGLRRDAGRHRAGIPDARRAGGAGLPAAYIHVPVRGGTGYRLQHPDDLAAPRAGPGRDVARGRGRRRGPACRTGDRVGRADPGGHVRVPGPGRELDLAAGRLRRGQRHRPGGVRHGDVLLPQPHRSRR
jgi:RND superfamily putative drug exporter